MTYAVTVCKHCKQETPVGLFCSACGCRQGDDKRKRIEAGKICQNCGLMVPDGVHCINCGIMFR